MIANFKKKSTFQIIKAEIARYYSIIFMCFISAIMIFLYLPKFQIYYFAEDYVWLKEYINSNNFIISLFTPYNGHIIPVFKLFFVAYWKIFNINATPLHIISLVFFIFSIGLFYYYILIRTKKGLLATLSVLFLSFTPLYTETILVFKNTIWFTMPFFLIYLIALEKFFKKKSTPLLLIILLSEIATLGSFALGTPLIFFSLASLIYIYYKKNELRKNAKTLVLLSLPFLAMIIFYIISIAKGTLQTSTYSVDNKFTLINAITAGITLSIKSFLYSFFSFFISYDFTVAHEKIVFPVVALFILCLLIFFYKTKRDSFYIIFFCFVSSLALLAIQLMPRYFISQQAYAVDRYHYSPAFIMSFALAYIFYSLIYNYNIKRKVIFGVIIALILIFQIDYSYKKIRLETAVLSKTYEMYDFFKQMKEDIVDFANRNEKNSISFYNSNILVGIPPWNPNFYESAKLILPKKVFAKINWNGTPSVDENFYFFLEKRKHNWYINAPEYYLSIPPDGEITSVAIDDKNIFQTKNIQLEGNILTSLNNDPLILIKVENTIGISWQSTAKGATQIFYLREGEKDYSEKCSVSLKPINGYFQLNIPQLEENAGKKITDIRIDPTNIQEDFILSNIKLYK